MTSGIAVLKKESEHSDNTLDIPPSMTLNMATLGRSVKDTLQEVGASLGRTVSREKSTHWGNLNVYLSAFIFVVVSALEIAIILFEIFLLTSGPSSTLSFQRLEGKCLAPPQS
jgi:hypothetical protein